MNKEQAIKILIQVAEGAQKGGLLNLKEAKTVILAIEALDLEEKPEVKGETMPPPSPKKN